jgi:voltage-gated sodium channel
LLTLTQVATYDDWGAIMRDLIEVHPWAWIYFVSYIIVNAVVLLNMVIGVIVDVMTGGRGVELLIDQESNSTHKKTANQEN